MGADQDVNSSGAMEEKLEEQRPFLKDGKSSDESVISVAPSEFGYNYGNRPYRDIGFSIAFAVFVTSSLGIGTFAAVNRNPDYYSLGSARYNPSEGCTIPEESHHAANSKSGSGGVLADVGDSLSLVLFYFGHVTLHVILATLILTVPLGFGLLWVLRKYTKEFVYATIPLFIFLPLGLAISIIVPCSMSEDCKTTYGALLLPLGYLVFIQVAYVWLVYKTWDRVELTIRIMRTASEALYRNLGLLLVMPALSLAALLLFISTVFCQVVSNANGKIITNPDLVHDPDLICGGSPGRPCCVWETDPWVPAYKVLVYFVLAWGLLVIFEIQLFTISGTISQWYFAVAESSTVAATKRSFLHAVGPSFGTVCFSALLAAFVSTIRSAIDKSRSSKGAVGFASLLVRACLVCCLSSVEFLTSFTTNFSAITGESFCTSAVMTYDLLRRNLLSTVLLESIVARLLMQAVLAAAAVYGLLVWGVLSLFVQDGVERLWNAMFGYIILFFFLNQSVNVLRSVVSTVYICFAMDKDHNEVSKLEVHDVYVLLPPSDDGTASLAVSDLKL